MNIKYLSLVLLSLATLGSVTSSYAQETTLTITQTPVLTTDTPTPSLTPTLTPTNTPPTPIIPSDSVEPESPENGNTMIGPPVPRQMMQQPEQQNPQGQVKSSFDEGGPDNIFDSKPNGGSSGVIKVIVTVIALTIAGVVGWITIQSNKPITVENETEDIDKTVE